MENTAKKGIIGEGKGEQVGFRCDRKLFRDRDKGLKVDETDELANKTNQTW